MMENLKEHRVEYFILMIAVTLFVVLTYINRFNKTSLIILSGMASLFYIFWGIIHHWLRGKLSKSIAFEYILYALLAFSLFYTVLGF